MRKHHKPFSEGTKQKMRKPKSEEHKKKLSILAIGHTRNRGRKHTEQSKLNMSLSHIGTSLTKEHRDNISKGFLRKKTKKLNEIKG